MTDIRSVGIEEVAARAGVATSTVSRALRGKRGVSDATRQRIEAIATELGYVPTSAAAVLASGRTSTIGVLVPIIDRWFFSEVLAGVHDEVTSREFDVMLFSLSGQGSNRGRLFDRALSGRKIDGLVVCGFQLSASERKRLVAAGIPVVFVGHSDTALPYVCIDEVSATETAVDFLYRLGHTKIGLLAGALEFDLNFDFPRTRSEGFRLAMAKRNLEVHEAWVERCAFTASAGRAAMQAMISTNRGNMPTAIVASSDHMAFGALQAAQEAHIDVPRDLSIVGFDDHPSSDAFGLTTIGQDAFGHGQIAARLVLGAVEGKPAKPASRPHQLVVRDTVTAAKEASDT